MIFENSKIFSIFRLSGLIQLCFKSTVGLAFVLFVLHENWVC